MRLGCNPQHPQQTPPVQTFSKKQQEEDPTTQAVPGGYFLSEMLGTRKVSDFTYLFIRCTDFLKFILLA